MDFKLCVTLFGSMSVCCGKQFMIRHTNRPTKPWELLALFLLYRGKHFSNQQLMDMLWEDEIENPAGALKNAVYSLRKTLQMADSETAYISTDNGGYLWNEDVSVEVDAIQFEAAAEYFLCADHPQEQRVEQAKRAARLYNGDILPGIGQRRWVMQYNISLHNKYVRIVLGVAELLQSRGCLEDFQTILNICNRAVQMEPLQEEFYLYIFKAMQELNMHKAILSYYPVVSNLFYDELGIPLTQEICDIYHQASQGGDGVQTDFYKMQQNLTEKAENPNERKGAYYCEYDTFRSLYQVMARTTERTGENILVLLVTVTAQPDKKADRQELLDAMVNLKRILGATLRRGDVFSRYSRNQYAMMLVIHDFKDEAIVKKRICSAYATECKGKTALYITAHPIEGAI
ncbi:MAG: BTAD domain-containing putative transcriptional regulator [Ruthenibacterium sp.]